MFLVELGRRELARRPGWRLQLLAKSALQLRPYSCVTAVPRILTFHMTFLFSHDFSAQPCVHSYTQLCLENCRFFAEIVRAALQIPAHAARARWCCCCWS